MQPVASVELDMGVVELTTDFVGGAGRAAESGS